MKLNKVMLAAGLVFGVSSLANAVDGTVTFTGEIIEAACSIHPDSVDQTVPLGSIAKHVLDNPPYRSTPRTFEIKLENCDLTQAAYVSTSFTGVMGPSTPTGGLGIMGMAKGASVFITDGGGNVVNVNGNPSSTQPLTSGNNTLNFSAYLQGDQEPTTNPVVVGDFNAIANFVMNYS